MRHQLVLRCIMRSAAMRCCGVGCSMRSAAMCCSSVRSTVRSAATRCCDTRPIGGEFSLGSASVGGYRCAACRAPKISTSTIGRDAVKSAGISSSTVLKRRLPQPCCHPSRNSDVLVFSCASICDNDNSTGFSTKPPTLSLKSRKLFFAIRFQSTRTGILPFGQKCGEIWSFV